MSAQGRSWPRGLGGGWPVILAWVVAVAAVGVFLVLLVGGQSRTVVRTVIFRTPAASASVTEDTEAGAVAAGQRFWASSDAATGAAMAWTLAYRIDSYTSRTATLDGWGVAIDSNGTRWQTVTVTVRYSGGTWRPPANAAGIKVSVDPALNPASPQFGASIASFHRLPGAP